VRQLKILNKVCVCVCVGGFGVDASTEKREFSGLVGERVRMHSLLLQSENKVLFKKIIEGEKSRHKVVEKGGDMKAKS